MGCRLRFTCTACEYTAEVSGGDDSGMAHLTTTIVCEDCKELSDILTGYLVETEEGRMFKNEPPSKFECGRSHKHRIRRWTTGDPCPKCGKPMDEGEATVLWD